MKKITFFIVLAATVAVTVIGYVVLHRKAGLHGYESSISSRNVEAPNQKGGMNPDNPVSARMEKIENDIAYFRKSKQHGAPSEQRIEMARNLNSSYFDARYESTQKKISDALTDALNEEEDLQVVKAIAFSHSRLPFNENTLKNLRSAYKRKALNFDDYFGELAHIYPNAPERIRDEIVKEIVMSNNRYAVDIIAGRIAHDEEMNVSSHELADLQKFLISNEPIFSGSLDAFGYFEAILYVDWLMATSRLQAKEKGLPEEKFLGIKLLDPDTDPRATVAFMVSGYAKNLGTSQREAIQWDAVRARADELMRKYPEAPGLQEIGKEMAR